MYRPATTLTVDNAMPALENGLRAITAGQLEIDLGELTQVDSSAVSILLAWQRAARARGGQLTCRNMPHNLRALVDLYDVSELLPAA